MEWMQTLKLLWTHDAASIDKWGCVSPGQVQINPGCPCIKARSSECHSELHSRWAELKIEWGEDSGIFHEEWEKLFKRPLYRKSSSWRELGNMEKHYGRLPLLNLLFWVMTSTPLPIQNHSLISDNHFMKLLLSAKGQRYFKDKGGWFNALIGNHVNK